MYKALFDFIFKEQLFMISIKGKIKKVKSLKIKLLNFKTVSATVNFF